MNKYDAYEITPMQFTGPHGPAAPCEPMHDGGEPDFWTLFGHVKGQGVEDIADYQTRDAALISLMTTALGVAKDALLNHISDRDVDYVLINEALRFAKERL